ncbi:MAG: N-acetyltransferase [Bacteroidetes bacterium]|nr:MAG: N-acetyltransferase [Bacteroidota bacterium]
MNFNPITINYDIISERLFLRQPRHEDVSQLFLLMSDEKLTHFLTWEHHKNIETTKAVVQSLIESQVFDKGYHWCILLNKKIIGLISLIDVRRKIRTWTLNRAELSYWIGTSFQGNGYATEASKKVIAFGFNNLVLHKIIVAHAAENSESMRICKKLHFHQYAYEHDAFQKDNIWNDLIWYELIKDKYESK